MDVTKGEISRLTRDILTRGVIYGPALINGIASPSKIARRILPDIAKQLGLKDRQIKLDTVVKAVKFYANEFKKQTSPIRINDIFMTIAHSSLSSRGDLAVITAKITDDIGAKLQKITDLVFSRDKILYISHGKLMITIIFDRRNMGEIVKIIGKNTIVRTESECGAVIMDSPTIENCDPLGMAGYIFDLIAINGINLVELMSSHTDGILVVKDNDLTKTYDVLNMEIKRLRAHLNIS